MTSIVPLNSDLTKGQHFLSDQIKRTKDIYLNFRRKAFLSTHMNSTTYLILEMLSSCQFYLYIL